MLSLSYCWTDKHFTLHGNRLLVLLAVYTTTPTALVMCDASSTGAEQHTHKRKPPRVLQMSMHYTDGTQPVSPYCTAGDTQTQALRYQPVSPYCTAGDTQTQALRYQAVSAYCTAGDTQTLSLRWHSISWSLYCRGHTNTNPPVTLCISWSLYCRRHTNTNPPVTLCISLSLYCRRHITTTSPPVSHCL
jgi:hypothetical protein